MHSTALLYSSTHSRIHYTLCSIEKYVMGTTSHVSLTVIRLVRNKNCFMNWTVFLLFFGVLHFSRLFFVYFIIVFSRLCVVASLTVRFLLLFSSFLLFSVVSSTFRVVKVNSSLLTYMPFQMSEKKKSHSHTTINIIFSAFALFLFYILVSYSFLYGWLYCFSNKIARIGNKRLQFYSSWFLPKHHILSIHSYLRLYLFIFIWMHLMI